MKMNNQEIQQYHRHRFPYLMIDCIEDVQPGISVHGYKNFSEDEWLFHCNIHEDEPVPFTMLIEVLTEVFLLSILTIEEVKGKIPYDVDFDDLNVFEDVFPGDRLDVKATVKSYRFGIASGIAEGFVRDKLVCSAKLKFVIPEIMESYLPKKQSNKS